MKKTIALVAVLACAVTAWALPALAADGPVRTFSQDVTLGFYRGQVVSYLDFGPVKLRAGNKVAPIWAFTNGDEGERNVIDTVPGAGTTRRSGRSAGDLEGGRRRPRPSVRCGGPCGSEGG